MNTKIHYFSSAVHILRDDGIIGLINAVITKLEDNSGHALATVALLFFHELHLLLEEQSVAYPMENNWQLVEITSLAKTRVLPTLSSRIQSAGTRHGSEKHVDIMERIYTYDTVVCVEDGDIVVDVGAYVGGFSYFASQRASTVISIEPTEATTDVLSTNMKNRKNVVVVAKAAWDRADTLQINQSSYPNENTILRPDRGGSSDSFTVSADTVPNIVREAGFDRIDFLKVEAEGVEPEILTGALEDGMEIRKIAVDASPERGGEDTVSEIVSILESHGYEFFIKENEKWHGEYIVFAK